MDTVSTIVAIDPGATVRTAALAAIALTPMAIGAIALAAIAIATVTPGTAVTPGATASLGATVGVTPLTAIAIAAAITGTRGAGSYRARRSGGRCAQTTCQQPRHRPNRHCSSNPNGPPPHATIWGDWHYDLLALTRAGRHRASSHRTGRRTVMPSSSKDPTHGSNSKTICTTPKVASAA